MGTMSLSLSLCVLGVGEGSLAKTNVYGPMGREIFFWGGGRGEVYLDLNGGLSRAMVYY